MREIVIDCETTGLDPREGHRVIEMAAVELDGVRVGRRWHSLFDPERDIDPMATDVHGYTWAKLKGQPKFAELAEDFLQFVDGATLIAHNSPFDQRFIEAEMWRAKHPEWRVEWIDTLPLARKKVPRCKGWGLDALCRHFGLRKTKRSVHSALLDVMLLAEIYARMVGRLDQLQFTEMEGVERYWGLGGEMVIIRPCDIPHPGQRPEPLPGRLTLAEARAHKAFVKFLEEDQPRAKQNYEETMAK